MNEWSYTTTPSYGGYTLVTLPRIVTPYRDSVDGTRARVRIKSCSHGNVTGSFRRAVGIWPSHQRDDTVTAGAGVDVQHERNLQTHL